VVRPSNRSKSRAGIPSPGFLNASIPTVIVSPASIEHAATILFSKIRFYIKNGNLTVCPISKIDEFFFKPHFFITHFE
jgi:hypothetical protein